MLLQAGLAPGMRVADFGCGVGAVTQMLAEIVGPAGHVTGIDMSGDQLLGFRIVDMTMHAWDLSRSLGLDESLDAEFRFRLTVASCSCISRIRPRASVRCATSSNQAACSSSRTVT